MTTEEVEEEENKRKLHKNQVCRSMGFSFWDHRRA